MSYRKKANPHERITPELLNQVLPQYKPISERVKTSPENEKDANLYKAISKDNKISIMHNPAYKQIFLIKEPDPTKENRNNMKVVREMTKDELMQTFIKKGQMLFVVKTEPIRKLTLEEAMNDSGYDQPIKQGFML